MHEVNEAKLAAQKLAKSGGETNELSIFEKIVQGQIPAKVAYKDDLVILIQLKINLSKFNISFSLIKLSAARGPPSIFIKLSKIIILLILGNVRLSVRLSVTGVRGAQC